MNDAADADTSNKEQQQVQHQQQQQQQEASGSAGACGSDVCMPLVDHVVPPAAAAAAAGTWQSLPAESSSKGAHNWVALVTAVQWRRSQPAVRRLAVTTPTAAIPLCAALAPSSQNSAWSSWKCCLSCKTAAACWVSHELKNGSGVQFCRAAAKRGATGGGWCTGSSAAKQRGD